MGDPELEKITLRARIRFDTLIDELIRENTAYLCRPGADCGFVVEAIFNAMEEITTSRLDFSSCVLRAFLVREEENRTRQARVAPSASRRTFAE